jgi:hypothetical protein
MEVNVHGIHTAGRPAAQGVLSASLRPPIYADRIARILSKHPCPRDVLARIGNSIAQRDHYATRCLQRIAALEFAYRNDFTIGREFPPERLGRAHGGLHEIQQPFDHPIYFRRDRRNAAIVSMPYGGLNTFAAADDFAERHGLRLHAPPSPWASFWYPGETLFLVFASARVREIVWLPEQCGGTA